MEKKINVGKNIKDFREHHHLSQAQFGAIVGVSNRAVSKWELNKNMPSNENLDRYSEHFGCPRSWITEGIPSEDERQLLHSFRNLSDANKEKLKKQIEKLKKG